MAEQIPMFRVNGRDYPVPTSFTVGEMCDAERYFGVEFGAEISKTSMRMVAALLWIAIRREDPTVTVDDIRALPPEVFATLTQEAEADPPAESPDSSSSDKSESSGTSGDASANGSAVPELAPSRSGTPVSATGATSE